jgi:ring-1,2-phenylacetyl-CoA epoxidase subunit PaaE
MSATAVSAIAMSDFMPLRVRAISHTTRDALVVTLEPATASAAVAFTAGQYLTLRTQIDGAEVRRCYSICSRYGVEPLRVAIKKVPDGAFSSWAHATLRVGDTLEALAPLGRFGELAPDADGAAHYLAIAAGSGITPILSIIKTRMAEEPSARVTLVFGNRSSASIMFREELEDLKNTYLQRLNIVHVLSREQQEIDLFNGRLEPLKCQQLLQHWLDASTFTGAFICGPLSMMEGARNALLEAGLAAERIRVELFAADADAARARVASAPAEQTPINAEIRIDGRSYGIEVIPRAETILAAGLRAGLELPYSCKAGVCATCVARLLEGEVDMDANFALEDYEVARGYILCCQSYAMTPRVVVEFEI